MTIAAIQRLLLIILFCLPAVLSAQKKWTYLDGSPFNGSKQDDLFFVDAKVGWSLNGSGEIWKTTNCGKSWKRQIHYPGTYFRCMGFIDSLTGFAGNIAPGFFENVTDINPMYRTRDGGKTWQVVTEIDGPMPTGLCAIDVVNDKVLYAGGRVSGPAFLMKSTDGGETWTSKNMSPLCEMIMDVKFFNPDTGFVFAGTHAEIEEASASILMTTDGGETWQKMFTSSRIHEICWKISFPTRQIGYATILSYSKTHPYRHFIKTTDGGLTWTEHDLDDNACVAFGIGFIDENRGWIGTDLQGYYTRNGGQTWKKNKLGKYTNKIRLMEDEFGMYGFCIGEQLFRWDSKARKKALKKYLKNPPIEPRMRH